jgi:hypothetical protein
LQCLAGAPVDGFEDQARHEDSVPSGLQQHCGEVQQDYMATAFVDAEASTLDWEVYLAPLLFAYNTAVSSFTKVTPFEATFGYNPRVPLWEGVLYPGTRLTKGRILQNTLLRSSIHSCEWARLPTTTTNRSGRNIRTSMTLPTRSSTCRTLPAVRSR